MNLSVLLFDFYLLVFGSTEDFRSSMMWSISYKFGTAQGQIIGRLHEHCTELLGVFEIVVKRRSSHPFGHVWSLCLLLSRYCSSASAGTPTWPTVSGLPDRLGST